MDRRWTRKIQSRLFWSVKINDQVVTTWWYSSSRRWCEKNTLTPRIFSHISTHFILVQMHRMAQGIAARVSQKHVCLLSLLSLTSSSLSSASTPSLISSSPLSSSSSFMWSEPPSTKSTAHPQNEEYCTVAIHNPLTGYEPNQLDNSDYSETHAVIFENESVDIDTEPSYSCDAELDDELVEKALSSPLFTQEREESANLRHTYLSWRKFVASSVLFHTYKYGRPVYEPSSNLSQKRRWSRDLENERIRILFERQKEQILAEVRSEIQKHELQAESDKRIIQENRNYWFPANGNWSYY